MKQEKTYGPYSQLPVAAAARLRGRSQDWIRKGMSEWKRTGGTRGLRHVEEEGKGGRTNRWTTNRWLDEWEDQLAAETLGRRRATRIRKQKDDIPVDENGLVTIPMKEFLRRTA